MKLSNKIIIWLLIILGIIISINSGLAIQKERAVLQQNLQRYGKALSHTIAISCLETLISEDYPVLNTLLRKIVKEKKEILSIEIIHNKKP